MYQAMPATTLPGEPWGWGGLWLWPSRRATGGSAGVASHGWRHEWPVLSSLKLKSGQSLLSSQVLQSRSSQPTDIQTSLNFCCVLDVELRTLNILPNLIFTAAQGCQYCYLHLINEAQRVKKLRKFLNFLS